MFTAEQINTAAQYDAIIRFAAIVPFMVDREELARMLRVSIGQSAGREPPEVIAFLRAALAVVESDK